MPSVIKISDCEKLSLAKNFKYASWPFKEFNPIQSRLLEVYEGDSNIAIAASTSAGKTVCAEMYMAYEVRKRGGKALYVGPMKALAKEKEQDWAGKKRPHHFNDQQIAICTGDYRISQSRLKELDSANIIIMTPEMLASRIRNHRSEKSQFLKDVKTVVFDETHLLTVPNRGDHIEVALMKLTELNPDVRLVLLSATMPNVDEICGWVTSLTNRDTFYLESNYRPCPLTIHYEDYYDGDNSYDATEASKVGTATGICEYYNEDKFLVFVHTKRTGQLMVKALKRCGINAEFHNADLGLDERLKLEDRFRSDPKFKVVVSTPTLAWGVNLPARRVIIVGVHRGLDRVENYNIQQMIGRAGRLGLDDRGDAYILVPESEKQEVITSLKRKDPITSTLLADPHKKTLGFHVVSEVYYQNIETKEAFHKWFNRSLAHYQDQTFDDSVVDQTIELLARYKALAVQEDGSYKSTAVGKIASIFYYSPFDVSDLRRNFHFLFEGQKENNDFAVSMCLGNVDTWRWGIVNKAERAEMATYQLYIERMYGKGKFTDACIKAGYAYHNMLLGKTNVRAFHGFQLGLQSDLGRTMEVLGAINGMATVWNRAPYFQTLGLRLRYGVGADLVELVQIPNVGQVRSKKLKAAGINGLADFIRYDEASLAKVMKCSPKLAEEALDAAKKLVLKQSL